MCNGTDAALLESPLEVLAEGSLVSGAANVGSGILVAGVMGEVATAHDPVCLRSPDASSAARAAFSAMVHQRKGPFPGPLRYLLTPHDTFSAIFVTLLYYEQPVFVPQSRHV